MKLTDPLATYTYYYSSPPVTVGEPVMVFFLGGGRPWVRLPKWSDLLQVQTTVFQVPTHERVRLLCPALQIFLLLLFRYFYSSNVKATMMT